MSNSRVIERAIRDQQEKIAFYIKKRLIATRVGHIAGYDKLIGQHKASLQALEELKPLIAN